MFRKPWESKDEATRASAVATSDDPKLLAKLADIAQHDPSIAVRLVALKRINTEPFWLDARLSSQDPKITEPADRFIAQQVIGSEVADYRSARADWLAAIIEEKNHRDLVQTIARKAPDPSLRAQALASIEANGFLADCFVEEPDQALAQSILERITDPSSLERVASALKKRSKAKSQALATRLSELKGVEAESSQIQQANAYLAEMDQLILGRASGHTAETLSHIEKEWTKLGPLPSELSERFEKARSLVMAIIHPPAKSPAPDTQNQTDRADESAGLESTEKESSTPPAVEPKEPKDPHESASGKKRSEKNKQTKGQRAREHAERVEHIEQLLNDAEKAIEHGSLQAAAEALASLPNPLPQAVRGHEARVRGQYQTLKNWLHWSNNSQRDQLIEKIESAITETWHPDALRELARESRQQWKDLEASERTALSAQRPAAPHRQWQRFSKAIDAIFELIHPALEHRQQYQDENLKALEAFITKTKQTLTSGPDEVSAYLEPLKTARLAIRRLADLPPKHRGEYAKALKDLMGELSEKVDHLFGQVEQRKRQLVAQAEQLAHEKDTAAAIEKAKSLQREWKALGRGRRQADQTLWSAFRAPIDPLFESIKKEQEAESQERQAHRERLEAILVDIETLAKQAGEKEGMAIAELKSSWARLADQWANQTDRPNALNARFSKAQARIEKCIEAEQAKAKVEASKAVDALASRLQVQWGATERAGQVQSTQPDELAEQDDPVDPSVKLPEHLARSMATLRQTLLALSEPNQSLDEWQDRANKNEGDARQVVVEMEFLSGLDSPADDADLKKAFQVAQLNERLNQRGQRGSLADDLFTRIERWYAALPMSEMAYADLSKRFKRARDVLEAMLG